MIEYFIKKNQQLTDRNRLDTEIRAFMNQYDHMLCPSEELFKDFIFNLKIKTSTLNNIHPSIKKKIEIRTVEQSNLVHIFISDQLSFIAYKVLKTYSPF